MEAPLPCFATIERLRLSFLSNLAIFDRYLSIHVVGEQCLHSRCRVSDGLGLSWLGLCNLLFYVSG